LVDDPRDGALSDLAFLPLIDDLGMRLLDGRQELADTDDPVISNVVQEEGGRPTDAAAQAVLEVLTDLICVGARSQLTTDPGSVKVEIGRVLQQVVIFERVLVLEEAGMHLEELPLGPSGFGRFGGVLRVRVQPREREVAEDEAELVTQEPLEILHDGHRCPAVRTLVISVLDQGYRSALRALDVVAFPHRLSEPCSANFSH
jgi:hypothetical protein